MFSDTDKDWEYYGRNDPYYGVVTHDEFRASNISDKALDKFFESGFNYVDEVIFNIHNHIQKEFNPKSALDFGCGVGRLIVPLAHKYQEVIGVDVSQSMLNEAQKNCSRYELSNVDFILSDDSLSKLTRKVDLIHSYIVFQHIPTSRGNKLFLSLLNSLNPGGVGVLHFTYKCSRLKRLFDTIPFFTPLYSLYKGKPVGDRPIQMNQYNLNYLLSNLQDLGCDNLYISFTRHGKNNDGVSIYFQKPL